MIVQLVSVSVSALIVIGALVFSFEVQRRRDSARIRELELQLYSAWKDGYLIPPKQSDLPEPEVEEALPRTLQALVDEWESPETKLRLTEEFRGARREGFGVDAIVDRYMTHQYGATAE